MSCNAPFQFLTASQALSQSRHNIVVFSEICAIQQAILSAIEEHKLDTVVANSSPMTAYSSVLEVTVNNPGSGYSVVQPTARIEHPTGTGATVIPVLTGGSIAGFIISNMGSGYDPVPPTADATVAGDGNATLDVFEIDGRIVSAFPTAPGSGYTPGDTINVVHPSGTGAVLTVATVNGTGGITAVNVTEPGNGYETVAAQVVVDHPVGAGFAGAVTVNNGNISDIVVLNGGAGYGTVKPTAVVTDATGVGAQLDVILSGDTVQSIYVVNEGAGYTDAATVTIQEEPGGTGDGATASVVLSAPGSNSVDYWKTWSGQITDRPKSDQIDQVFKYFQKLGYNIQLQVNPATSNTLQWKIYW